MARPVDLEGEAYGGPRDVDRVARLRLKVLVTHRLAGQHLHRHAGHALMEARGAPAATPLQRHPASSLQSRGQAGPGHSGEA